MAETEIKQETEQENMEKKEENKQETAEQEVTSQENAQENVESSKEDEQQETPSSQKEETMENQLEELHTKLAEAERKAEENYQKFLRAQADLENFRRRTRKEREEQTKYASLPLIEQLLPVLDNFDRALAASTEASDVENFAKGVDMVFRQVKEILQKEGLEPIEAIGTPFDPNFHQAVMMVDSEEHESGIVVEEVQKGYKLKDRVIRPAMVKVSS